MFRSTALALSFLSAVLACGCTHEPEPPPIPPPFTLEELYACAGASVLEPAAELEKEWMETVDEGWTVNHPELERFLEDHASTLSVLRERTGTPDTWSELSSVGYEPGLFEARRLAYLLLLEGRRHERHGRHDEALESALVALHLAHRHMHEGEVPLIVHVIGQSLQWPALNSIRSLNHRSRTSDEAWRRSIAQLQALRAAWPELEPALGRESESILAATEEGYRQEQVLDEPGAQRVLEKLRQVTDEYTQLFVDSYETGDLVGLRAELDARERALNNPFSLLGAAVLDEREARLTAESIAQMLYPNLVSSLEADMRARLAIDMERVALAIRLSWVARGRKPPESLDELVPDYLDAIPEDLFALGEPLRLARHEKHWWIYSVGPDGKDDGGKLEYSARAPEAGGDILSVSQRNRRPHQ